MIKDNIWYQQGWDAMCAGESAITCPYTAYCIAWLAWRDGHSDAMDALSAGSDM